MESSYFHSTSDEPLVHKTFWELLNSHCDVTPDREAVVFYQSDVRHYSATFKELRELTLKFAACLLERFPWLQVGHHVAVIGTNVPEVLLSQLTAYRLGLMVIFPPTGLKHGRDLIESLNMTQCQGIIFQTLFVDISDIELIFKSVPTLQFAIVFGDNSSQYKNERVFLWDTIMKKSTKELSRCSLRLANEYFSKVQPENEVVAYFTSGSTGKPKAVPWTHFSVVNNMLIVGEINKLNYHTRYLQDRPITNGTGATMTSHLVGVCGCTAIILNSPDTIKTTNPEIIYRIIEKEQVTDMLMCGYMMHDFIASPPKPEINLGSLQKVSSGAQVRNQKHFSQILSIIPQLQIVEGYGASEMGMVTMSTEMVAGGFIGKPFRHSEVKVIGSEGQTLPRDQQGELCYRNPTLFSGYITEKGLLSCKDKQGWFHTDDIAIINKNGEIKVLGRKSDSIRRANVLIFPAVIEKVILNHPKVNSVQVIGVSDPRIHKDICACVVPSNPTLTEKEIRDWCNEKFMVDKTGLSLAPRYFFFLDDFPHAASGKIDRKALTLMAEKMTLT